MCTAYGKTTCSSKILADFKAPYTATAVEKLQAAGAVVIGKTNLDEFAMGSSTENSATKVTHNPWDLDRVPGGSSGGSGACVSARLAAAALGSDTGGSIRQPAAFCGVVGLKPTYGRVSRYGLVAYGSSLDQIGPMTVDVPDAALLTGVISGHDPHDSTSADRPIEDYLAQVDTPIENLRIGLPDEFFTDALDPEIARTITQAADLYKGAGAEIVHVSLPHSRIDADDQGNLSSYAVACYYIVAMSEASSNLARYDGVHYGHRTDLDVDGIVELFSRSRAEGFGDEVKRRIMLGTYTLSSGYYDAYYNKALKVRRLIKNDFDQAFDKCDVLLCPTSPTTAFGIGEKTADPLTMYLADIYTISLNLAGLPGVSIPAGLDASGMPVGMQLIGPEFSESRILRAARMYENISGVTHLIPQIAQS
jgi:aspartyl-tRNA(Asn)/glutamyl-tRNA(Gln) amidotransferase subunit A